MVLSVFYVEASVPFVTAPESPPPPVPVIPVMTLEEIQTMISQNGYNFTVGETWVFQLSPQAMVNLLGYRPPPMDLSHLASTTTVKSTPYQLPSSYDYRDTGMVTPPKNQSSCGSCWCFAAVGEMESRILVDGGPEYDLSEENVLSCNIYGAGCGGGDDIIVVNYYTKEGTSLEACAPYDATDGTPCADCPYTRKLCGWEIIGTNLDSENPTVVETVKQALMDYGPLWVTMDASGPGFSSYTGGVYEWWNPSAVNHAVLLIGWDDALTHSHGSGAWIVKNSWGTGWGDNGYFYIAYGSAMICDYVSAYSLSEEYSNTKTLYYYDDYGWWGSFYQNPNDTWGAVRYTPAEDGVLERVEFWAVDDVLNYEIYVYDTRLGSGPYTFDGLLTSHSGSVTKAGYYSIELTTQPFIAAGNDFIVAVRFNTPNFQYPVPIDTHAPIGGESYSSANGSSWLNLSQEGNNWDIGIRAVIQQDIPTFAEYPGLFDTNSYFVVGDTAYCTDVLGTGKIAYGLGAGGVTENPEGRTDLILTTAEHDTGNLIIVGGPAVNPVATEFDSYLGITYDYNPGVSFEIFCEGYSIFLDIANNYPDEDICIVYLGSQNSRNSMVVWGFGWYGTYAGSILAGNAQTWQTYASAHLLLVRWIDANSDELVQEAEITVEAYA